MVALVRRSVEFHLIVPALFLGARPGPWAARVDDPKALDHVNKARYWSKENGSRKILCEGAG